MELAAINVAKRILTLSALFNEEMTNLKLQKLLYYCQGWYLALERKPFFTEQIEAWVHGPVVPVVFREYRAKKWNPIAIDSADSLSGSAFGSQADSHIKEVLNAYRGLTGTQLEKMTHNEDPWKIARGNTPIDMPSQAVVTHESMISYFRLRISKGRF